MKKFLNFSVKIFQKIWFPQKIQKTFLFQNRKQYLEIFLKKTYGS